MVYQIHILNNNGCTLIPNKNYISMKNIKIYATDMRKAILFLVLTLYVDLFCHRSQSQMTIALLFFHLVQPVYGYFLPGLKNTNLKLERKFRFSCIYIFYTFFPLFDFPLSPLTPLRPSDWRPKFKSPCIH